MASGSVTLSGSTAAITTLSGGRVSLSGAALTVGGGTFAGTLSGSTGSLRKTGPGVLVLAGSSSLSAPTTVLGGVLRLDDASALAASRVTAMAGGTLTIAPRLAATIGGLAANAGGLIDVRDGSITVVSGLSAADLVTAIVAGRGDGSWTGTSGISSSVAAADVASSIPRAVGWVDNGDGSVMAAYAAPGDTNVDQLVDVLDAGNFLTLGKFDTALPASWFEGDFNYDNLVDVLDAADFFGTGLYDTGVYNGGAGGIASVPEPTVPVSIILVIAAHAAIAARRRHT
jgi:autotransporter-associated beta strand protein